ncbi:MAG: UDP-N-acetylmuramate dehydrogenase [Betaproteobacteria bacterium]|nr:UDP-N-acetylmuramate dehydrogenase [Betaproteobacteria bacterium]
MPFAITPHASLAALNTLALPGEAEALVTIATPADLISLAANPQLACRRRFILGGGSNLVIGGDFAGIVLRMAIPGRELAAEDDEAWYLRAGAGENWHDFVRWSLHAGYPGLENLSLIPGTVGAAPIQNIGAYGLEVGERFHHLEAVDLQSGETVRFDRHQLRFGYRDSLFKQEGWHLDGRYAITHVTFRLEKRWQAVTRYADVDKELAAAGITAPTALQVSDAIIAIRQRKLPDPAQIPNSGSFFHNPVVDAATASRLAAEYPSLPHYPQPDGRVKLAAGWLIEQAGWKGRNLGPAGMYEKQALVLVNRGEATGADVKALMGAVQADVRGKFGVMLTPEPIFL